MTRISDLITDELENPLLSTKLVCRELELSRSTLFAILADANMMFVSHIRELRFQRCLMQIRDPRSADIAIGEIARRAGFASQESFTRAFKRRYGSPPGSYRGKEDS
ncbi:helix-turn-helix transcriptional regulator [Bradyrhizobium sp. NBAIM08]|uniref:helix-turn-helix transcriptional regulator n=1 Tax=Bradyrhizobium sp. NBAIM08 TaxID=2793815 RepID=UPI001CD6537B|nr:helix-turn-helix transcriptional regulator [Bradyrhizobium sp. NBAIM08]MCA1479840.1 helix-turn-helix transcriptional regulator [Bradyrhizobium sp. NBAIM08]